ncbi:FAD-dependent oxidoreductase [Candidatus Aerophobetes bacterium]|nr:FAD-dependent oxidoreductase [Candidatus Aerophobetes bacterium]
MKINIPTAEDIHLLKKSVRVNNKEIPNSLCVNPMEGRDGKDNGSPGELTYRRYRRFASGGAGIIWIEATAVTSEGRVSPRQLWINNDSAEGFKKLVKIIKANALNYKGERQSPFTVLQLTHSGRQSSPEPVITHHSKILDANYDLDLNYPLISDDELDNLQDEYVKAAQIAYECGFDAVDIKACHGYLLHELLFSYTRKGSKYGGSFQNRTRFLQEVVKKIKRNIPDLIITTRLNIYDGIPYPWGWGMKKDGSLEIDLSEPVNLIKELREAGVEIINIAVGNPYYNAHLERPYDYPIADGYSPEEHPLKTISRNIDITSEISRKVSGIHFVGTGLSWLRQFFPNVGAAMIQKGWISFLGVGRAALSNPNFANELLKNGDLALEKLCIACSSCTQIMKDGGCVGCVVRDSEVYGPIYRAGRLRNTEYVRELAASCMECSGPPCVEGCPARMDIPGFIGAFLEGDIRKSYHIMKKQNIIPEICAYICPSETLCEAKCIVKILDGEPVPIRQIQKLVSEEARKRGYTKLIPGRSVGKRVAVIGFGPAGIACSAHLIEQGHSVTVFEASQHDGGLIATHIPKHRIDCDVIQKEIEALGFKELDLFQIKYGKKLSKNCDLDFILNGGYDAVFLGIGLQEPLTLFKDTNIKGVLDALTFLKNLKILEANKICSQIKGQQVAVIGGGAMAMDAAVAAVNCGAKDVYLLYRRSLKQMPVWPKQQWEVIDKGVHFLLLSQPVEYISNENNKLCGIKVVRIKLGHPDISGRRIPEKIPKSEYILNISLCIEAIGQKIPEEVKYALGGVQFTANGLIKVKNDTYETSRKGVFASGDVISGDGTVVKAVSDGLNAAIAIDRYLKNREGV